VKAVRLKNLCVDTGQYGLNISPGEYVEPEDGIRLIRTSDISDGRLRPTNEGIFVPPAIPAAFRLRADDILVSRAGTIGRSYLVPSEAEGMTFAGFLIRFRPVTTVEPRFLSYSLQSTPVQEQIDSESLISTIQNFNAKRYANLQIWSPDLLEQRRIADFLDDQVARLDRAISLRGSEIALAEAREAERLSWTIESLCAPLLRLSWVCRLQSGVTVDKARRAGRTYPYLRVANVQADTIDLSEVKEIELSPEEARQSLLRSGDVLMTEGGDIDKLGRGSVWEGSIDPCVHQNHIFALRPEPALLDPYYLAFVTRTRTARSYFESTGTQSTNLASTNSTKVLAFRLPVPDVAVQRRTAIELFDLHSDSQRFSTTLLRHEELLTERKQALITATVTGQLDVTTARSGV
jgi:type I restriction enzyme S subunit